MKAQLVQPSTEYKESFLEAQAEFAQELYHHLIDRRINFQPDKETFAQFVERLNGYGQGNNLPEGWVPETQLWLVDGEIFIGRVSIRHHLTESLRSIGGHIGYAIRPSKRRQGYGTQALALALPKARELGLEKVLVTCDVTNVGSRKIIEKNGGQFEDEHPQPSDKPPKRRYWISLT